MKSILLLIFTLTSPIGFTQHNSTKGRAITNKEMSLFSAGIGVERMITEKISGQVMFNYIGMDLRGGDGNAEFTSSFVPEIRYYFHYKKDAGLNRSFFLGIFAEFSETKILFNGFGDYLSTQYLLSGKRKLLNPGLLIGKKIRLSDKWYIELFAGAKYRFIYTLEEHFSNGVNYSTVFHSEKWGIRGGLNIGLMF